MSENSQPGPPWTPLKLINWTKQFFASKGIDSPRLDAEILLAHVLDIARIQLYAQFDRPVSDEELATFRALVKRRADHEPAAYLVGYREFWSLEFQVDHRVLIPRPDTEVLVQAALKRLPDERPARLVDVGTGSGAIAVALASERQALSIAATDLSDDALAVARENASQLVPDADITFFDGDLLAALPESWRDLDMVVSNPPYVAETERSEMAADVLDFEPGQALFAGDDGLDVIRRLIDQAPAVLASQGWLLFEIGYRQGDAVRQLLQDAGYQDVEILSDYGDRDRVAVGRCP